MKSQAYQFIYNEINVGFILNPNNSKRIDTEEKSLKTTAESI